MINMKKILTPATWFFYLVVVCAILFMISPFALHFYSAYGPTLNFLHRSPSTVWLSKFFLPHFSQTTSLLLNALPKLAGLLVLVGLVIFLAGAIPVYWAKLRGRGAVTGGLYVFIRHPQYVGLSILGLGTLLIWPRFLVLITYIHHAFPLLHTGSMGGRAVSHPIRRKLPRSSVSKRRRHMCIGATFQHLCFKEVPI
jgi:protein-S-isoprenylcysteine O-methyltransferase Ste14